jgi:hypothetical protein
MRDPCESLVNRASTGYSIRCGEKVSSLHAGGHVLEGRDLGVKGCALGVKLGRRIGKRLFLGGGGGLSGSDIALSAGGRGFT